ncbi:MAG: type VII toxin-antitoxin system MntA family adenylyltransferase antitoxin [Bacillota bacterium]
MSIIDSCRDILIKYNDILFAYLFGSFVKGKVREDSDIDIAIYQVEKLDTDTYLAIKSELSEACKREIDLIILNDATPLLKYEIYRNNILLFSRDKSVESNFKVKTLFEYNDFKKYLDLSYTNTIDRLRKEVESDG